MQGIVWNLEEDASIRIRSVELENFKSVRKGHIDFVLPGDGEASITGIYGQNGSGKTAMIDALAILKQILSGRALNKETAEKISTTAKCSHFNWTFEYTWPGEGKTQTVSYSYDLIPANPQEGSGAKSSDCQVTNEIVSAQTGDRLHTRKVIDTSAEDYPFSPLQQFRALTGGGGSEKKVRLGELKRNLQHSGRSFIFSIDFMQHILGSRDHEGLLILYNLHHFGQQLLYVMTVRDMDRVSADWLHTYYSIEEKDNSRQYGEILLPLNSVFEVSEQEYENVQEVLRNTSYLLGCIIPDQQISLKIHEKTQGHDNNGLYRVQLVSIRGQASFPFRYESEGVKKLVSILILLARVYCSREMTLAIDELDSGIFEILLGEILESLASEGEGQLIFTSHNLRPLEVLKPENIVFTTIDPNNRYKRIKGVRGTNNLRKMYIRDIFLRESDPPLYCASDQDEIATAFQKAGKIL